MPQKIDNFKLTKMEQKRLLDLISNTCLFYEFAPGVFRYECSINIQNPKTIAIFRKMLTEHKKGGK